MLLIAQPMDVVDEAAWLTEAERVEGVRLVRAELATAGATDCIGCGDEIEAARREALPSARRCVVCQGRVEHRGKTRAADADGRARPAIVGDGL